MTMHELFGDFEYYVVALISLTVYVLLVVAAYAALERWLDRMGWLPKPAKPRMHPKLD